MVVISMFALIDINNFYVSCERVFAPHLHNKPVCVLSNNDGCIVARSNEVKAAGIPMGAPYFEWRDTLKSIEAVVFSSNYTLYGDMSRRVMETLKEYGPLEIYSIDEAFLDVSHIPQKDLLEHGKHIRSIILQHLGLPCCVGFGTTKTLAKAANEIAKQDSKKEKSLYNGVFELHANNIHTHLSTLGAGNIWGIGRKSAKKLEKHHIYTALDFKQTHRETIRKLMGMMGVRTHVELHGIKSLAIEEVQNPKKAIVCSRSFGRDVTNLAELKQAVALYTTRAAEKLRKQHSCTTNLSIYIRAGHWRNGNYSMQSKHVVLSRATNHTPTLVREAIALLEYIYKSGFKYKKAAVMVWGFVPEGAIPDELFVDSKAQDIIQKKYTRSMHAIDTVNKRYGSNTLKVGQMGTNLAWYMKSNARSPRYTTVLDEVLHVS
jgi:DNA polymerase V